MRRKNIYLVSFNILYACLLYRFFFIALFVVIFFSTMYDAAVIGEKSEFGEAITCRIITNDVCRLQKTVL